MDDWLIFQYLDIILVHCAVYSSSGLLDFRSCPETGQRKFWVKLENWSKHAAEKRCTGLIVFKPYRKPTQVDKRKYAKVNG